MRALVLAVVVALTATPAHAFDQARPGALVVTKQKMPTRTRKVMGNPYYPQAKIQIDFRGDPAIAARAARLVRALDPWGAIKVTRKVFDYRGQARYKVRTGYRSAVGGAVDRLFEKILKTIRSPDGP